MGVHQSIGMKGIVLFGNDEQKERFLPDLASGRKLAGFALTEPEAGSDVHGMQTRAERAGRRLLASSNGDEALHRQRLEGRRCSSPSPPPGDERRHTAFILEKGMEGFEVGQRFDTMGLRGNDLRELLLQRRPRARGERARRARRRLQDRHARSSTTAGCRSGTGLGRAAPSCLLDLTIDHVKERTPVRPAARRLRAGAGQDRLDGLLPVRARVDGLPHHRPRGRAACRTTRSSRRSCKVAGTEFLWYAANRALQLKGGAGYMRDRALREDPARHPHLPDLRGRQRRDARLHRARRA